LMRIFLNRTTKLLTKALEQGFYLRDFPATDADIFSEILSY